MRTDQPPPDIASALAATAVRRGAFGAPLHYLLEAPSTNDAAASLAERGAPEGTTVVALAQTNGRGRQGREWFSPPGAGLYVSVVCRDQKAAPLLTLAGGVAVAEGIRAATGLPVQIKWPNDVVLPPTASGRGRKLAGILAEASTGGSGLLYVILGFGINIRPAPYPPAIADRATSIETELGRPADAGPVLAETLAVLADLVASLSDGSGGAVVARWRDLSPSSRGARVEWTTPAGLAAGTATGIADDGALLVRVGSRTERIIAGELRWRD